MFLYSGLNASIDTTPLSTEGLAEGVWTWFVDPRAVRFNGITYIGTIDSAGNCTISSFPDGSGMSAYSILNEGLDVDDHANPAILVRDSDSKIMAFYCAHTGPSMYLRISTNAEDVSAWGAETDLTASITKTTAYTYPLPIQLTGEVDDPIWLHFRDAIDGSTQAFRYSKSTDDGATWSTDTVLYANTGTSSYLKPIANGTNRIDYVATDGHPLHDTAVSIYHFYYTGGNYYKSDGTLIGNSSALPLTSADITQIYDGTTYESWLWDIAINGSGNPVVTFAKFISTTDHRYMYALWTGSAWAVNEITTGGTYMYAAEPYYSGGVCIYGPDTNIVYSSRESGGVWEIYKHTTGDGGSSWSTESITNNSRYGNFRPFVPRNAGGATKVLWFCGRYTDFQDYYTNIKGSSY